MKTNRYFMLIALLGVVIACSKPTLKKYSPHSSFPRAVYVENQIQKIQTTRSISAKNLLYVDISMNNGKKESGRLIKISEDDVELSRGYHYQSDKDKNVEIKEDVITIPKRDILILKIW